MGIRFKHFEQKEQIRVVAWVAGNDRSFLSESDRLRLLNYGMKRIMDIIPKGDYSIEQLIEVTIPLELFQNHLETESFFDVLAKGHVEVNRSKSMAPDLGSWWDYISGREYTWRGVSIVGDLDSRKGYRIKSRTEHPQPCD